MPERTDMHPGAQPLKAAQADSRIGDPAAAAQPPMQSPHSSSASDRSTASAEGNAEAAVADATISQKNMLILIQLRWIAVIGQIVAIVMVQFGLRIDLPLRSMTIVLGGLVLMNLLSLAWMKRRADIGNAGLLAVVLLDVAALTAQLYLSGGATNPFAFLYLLQVTLAAVLLDAVSTWVVVTVTFACFAGLTIFYQPLALPHPHAGSIFTLHIVGMLACFALVATLLVVFATRITRNIRERDARLAALKQHAFEEDHIVRMGLLASGAAHELGTPLASLSVILNDWQHMPALTSSPELSQELEEMQAAVQRCKTIVTGILLSSGEARGESPSVTTVNAFLDELIDEWRVSRSATTLSYANAFGTDVPIVSDSALQHVIFNVLDNAYEASPGWLNFVAEREGGVLIIRISDAGPGFAPEMLAQFGKPYHSSKGRPGGGLGLFLVVNAVRKLGGFVTARNRPEGGAVVTLKLPLSMLTIGANSHGG